MYARQDGFALVLVLWALTVLTVITTTFAFAAREERLLGHSLYQRAQAHEVARAGVNHAIFNLLHPNRDRVLIGDGVPDTVRFGNSLATIKVQAERGKIHLNLASVALLEGIVAVAGAGTSTPAAVAAAIGDWRDANDTPLPQGAEFNAYRDAGLAAVPANRPFVSLAELRLVFGLDAATANNLARYLTVHGRSSKLDLSVAPVHVLAALPGANAQDVQAFVEARQTDRRIMPLAKGLLPTRPGIRMYATSRAGNNRQPGIYTIESTGKTEAEVTQTVRVVVQIFARKKPAYRVLEWHQEQAQPESDGAQHLAPTSAS